MQIDEFIAKQQIERQNILTNIHDMIIKHDKCVSANIGLMMGKDMIIYKAKGFMKYGLSSVKNYMSLHAMPIYGSTVLHAKYKLLLPSASFQKGCINFKTEADIPLEIVKELIVDWSKIDLMKIKEEYMKSKMK